MEYTDTAKKLVVDIAEKTGVTYDCNDFGIINLQKYFPLFFAPIEDEIQVGSQSNSFEKLFDVEYSNTAGVTGTEGIAGNMSPEGISGGDGELNLFATYVDENIDESRCENELGDYKNDCLRAVNLLNKYDGIFAIMAWDTSALAGIGQKVSVIVKGETPGNIEEIQEKYLEILEGTEIEGKEMSDIDGGVITPVKIVKRDSETTGAETIITGLIFNEVSDERKVCSEGMSEEEKAECEQIESQFVFSQSCLDDLTNDIINEALGYFKDL